LRRALVAARYAAITLACALPAVVCLDYVMRFGVNCPYWDEFQLVPLIDRLANGQLTLADVFAQHNEHRVVFPTLLMLGLARLTAFQQVPEMLTSWALLLATCAMLLTQHVRCHGRSLGALASFIPVPFLIFTLRQEENLLWGWQVTMALFLAAAVATFAAVSAARFAVAIACAVVATYSFAAGLAVWPIGGLVLLLRWRWMGDPRVRVPAFAWCIAGTIAVAIYFVGYVRPGYIPSPAFPILHPWQGAHYIAVVLGTPLSRSTSGVALAGGVVIAACVACAWLVARGLVDRGKALIAVPLVVLALGNAVLLALGRGAFGPVQASSSRYVAISVLGLIGIWWIVLAVRPGPVRAIARSVALGLVVAAVFASYDGAYRDGAVRRAERRELAALLRDYATRSDVELRPLFLNGGYVRQQATVLERRRLSVFARPG